MVFNHKRSQENKNDLLTDVRFVVLGWNVGSDFKSVIPAPEFVLAISSPE